MKSATILLALSAAPAFAHPGAHVHPHAVDGWIGVALGLALIAFAVTGARKLAKVTS